MVDNVHDGGNKSFDVFSARDESFYVTCFLRSISPDMVGLKGSRCVGDFVVLLEKSRKEWRY